MQKSLLATLLLTILLLGFTRADVARVADLKNSERIEVEMLFLGNVGRPTKFTFTADKVLVVDINGKVGEAKLTVNERAAIDRHLDVVRKGPRGRGEASYEFKIRLFRNDREKRGFREELQVASSVMTEARGVLTLDALLKRAIK